MSKPALELTSRCDNNCQMCPFRLDGKFEDLGDMDFNLFRVLVDGLAPDSEALMLFNRGEPFLYPKIYEAIKYGSKKSSIIISTNGIKVDPKKLYQVLRQGLLVVSLPAGDNKTYKEIAGTENFNKVKKNIIELYKTKPKEVEMYVKIVKQKENEGHVEKIREWFKGLLIEVEDSNQPNPHGYTDCTQPDVTPIYDWHGNKKVCCRDVNGDYPYSQYYDQAKRRELDICKRCAIR